MSNKSNKSYLYLIAKKAIKEHDIYQESSKIYAQAIANANCWCKEYAVEMITLIDKLTLLDSTNDLLANKENNTILEMQQHITRCRLIKSSTNTKQKKRRIVRKKTTVEV